MSIILANPIQIPAASYVAYGLTNLNLTANRQTGKISVRAVLTPVDSAGNFAPSGAIDSDGNSLDKSASIPDFVERISALNDPTATANLTAFETAMFALAQRLIFPQVPQAPAAN